MTWGALVPVYPPYNTRKESANLLVIVNRSKMDSRIQPWHTEVDPSDHDDGEQQEKEAQLPTGFKERTLIPLGRWYLVFVPVGRISIVGILSGCCTCKRIRTARR